MSRSHIPELSRLAAGDCRRIGRYVGDVQVVQLDTEFSVDYRYEELMYQMADHLSGTLHELAVTDGIIPSLSSKQAIQVVFDHIERGEPIQYDEDRPDMEESPRCEDLLNASFQAFLYPDDKGSDADAATKYEV